MLNPHKTSLFSFTQVSNCCPSALSHSFSSTTDPLSIHPYPSTLFYLLIESDSLSNSSISDQTWSQSLQANSDSESVSLPYVATRTLSWLLYALRKHLVFQLFFIQQIQHICRPQNQLIISNLIVYGARFSHTATIKTSQFWLNSSRTWMRAPNLVSLPITSHKPPTYRISSELTLIWHGNSLASTKGKLYPLHWPASKLLQAMKVISTLRSSLEWFELMNASSQQNNPTQSRLWVGLGIIQTYKCKQPMK